MLRLAVLLALLIPAASAQAPRSRPVILPDTAAADTAAADTAAADSARRPTPRRAATPTEAALGRLGAALRQGVAPEGPFPALDARFAGVTYVPRGGTADAIDALVAMRRAGVRAARTPLIADTLVLAAASRLGIALYQDLPVEGLPAATLAGRTAEVEALLIRALARGRRYPAARHYGLASGADTSDPDARPYLDRLTAVAHAAGAETYFLTRFPRTDRAAASVDLVLLDASDADPVALLRTWRAGHETPAGLASVGATVVPGRDGGWRTPGSPAAQARHLENVLNALVALDRPPAVTFLGHWRDVPDDGDLDVRARVSGVRDGLHDAAGAPRPALAVARGFFTGTQRVFAIDAGSEASDAAPRGRSALLVLAWTLVVGLGLFMVGAPRMGTLVPRYFARHDLYREAVARGYDLSAAETIALGLGLSVAFGIVGAAVLRALSRTEALVAAVSSWPVGMQGRLIELLGQPLVTVLVLALVALAWGMIQLVWLFVVSGRRRVRVEQALSLVVWSRWAWVPLMALALLLAGVGPQTATALAPALVGLGVLAETVALYRSMLDLAAVARVPPARALGLGFGVPLVLAAAGLVALALTASAEATFVWHLATRG